MKPHTPCIFRVREIFLVSGKRGRWPCPRGSPGSTINASLLWLILFIHVMCNYHYVCMYLWFSRFSKHFIGKERSRFQGCETRFSFRRLSGPCRNNLCTDPRSVWARCSPVGASPAKRWPNMVVSSVSSVPHLLAVFNMFLIYLTHVHMYMFNV